MPAISPLLGLGLAASNVPNTINEGRKERKAAFEADQDRKDKREQAQKRSDLMDLQLKAAGRADTLGKSTQDAQVEAMQQQLHTQTQQNRQLSNKMTKTETHKALDNFFQSGDPRSMNQFFKDNKDNPTVKSMFKGVIRMDKLNLKSSEDRSMLRQAGFSDEELDAADGKKDGKIDWDVVSKRFVKSIREDGETKVTDMLYLASVTGYGDYADDKMLTRLERLAKLQKDQKGDPETRTALQKNADAISQAQDRIDAGKGTTRDYETVALGDAKKGGVSAGKEAISEKAIGQWNNKGYDSLSQEELQNTPDAGKLVRKIELAHGLSEAQQTQLIDLGSLVTLSGEAGALSDPQTGVWDRMTNNVTSYTNDQIGGKKNRAAYGAFINEFRHNLFGSALTDGELKAFKEAYGGLGQKAGPVIAGLRAALIQVKSKLDTISDLNNPAVVKYRFGGTMDDVSASVAGLDARIEFYDKVAGGMDPDQAAKEMKAAANPAPSTPDDIDTALFGAN